jgi:hypothetical protein
MTSGGELEVGLWPGRSENSNPDLPSHSPFDAETGRPQRNLSMNALGPSAGGGGSPDHRAADIFFFPPVAENGPQLRWYLNRLESGSRICALHVRKIYVCRLR